jgi:acyl carrier protein
MREILTILTEHMLLEVESADTDLIASGLLDSVGLVSLIVEIEGRFDVAIPIDELEAPDVRSVRALARFVASAGVGTCQ